MFSRVLNLKLGRSKVLISWQVQLAGQMIAKPPLHVNSPKPACWDVHLIEPCLSNAAWQHARSCHVSFAALMHFAENLPNSRLVRQGETFRRYIPKWNQMLPYSRYPIGGWAAKCPRNTQGRLFALLKTELTVVILVQWIGFSLRADKWFKTNYHIWQVCYTFHNCFIL